MLGSLSVGQEEMTLGGSGSSAPTARSERFRFGQRPVRAFLRPLHRHVLGFMRYELRNADGVRLVRDRKTGFASATATNKQSLPGRAPSARYRTAAAGVRRGCCGSGKESRSAGATTTPTRGQELDITGLPAGRYVIVHRVNANRDLRESDYSDNASSLALDLSWPRDKGCAADRRRRPLPAAGHLSVTSSGSSGAEEGSAPSRLADSGRGQQEEEHDVVLNRKRWLRRTTPVSQSPQPLFAAVHAATNDPSPR